MKRGDESTKTKSSNPGNTSCFCARLRVIMTSQWLFKKIHRTKREFHKYVHFCQLRGPMFAITFETKRFAFRCVSPPSVHGRFHHGGLDMDNMHGSFILKLPHERLIGDNVKIRRGTQRARKSQLGEFTSSGQELLGDATALFSSWTWDCWSSDHMLGVM